MGKISCTTSSAYIYIYNDPCNVKKTYNKKELF